MNLPMTILLFCGNLYSTAFQIPRWTRFADYCRIFQEPNCYDSRLRSCLIRAVIYSQFVTRFVLPTPYFRLHIWRSPKRTIRLRRCCTPIGNFVPQSEPERRAALTVGTWILSRVLMSFKSWHAEEEEKAISRTLGRAFSKFFPSRLYVVGES